MRVMLDTNILISGMIFQGSERRLLETILKNNHVLVLGRQTKQEAKAVLTRKFSISEKFLNIFLKMFSIEWIPISSSIETEKLKTLIRDPKDIPILAAAVSAKPDLFVTGDKDFHTPEVKKLIPVYTATQALNSL